MQPVIVATEQLTEALAHVEDLKKKCRAGMIIGFTGSSKTFTSTLIKNKYSKNTNDVFLLTVSSTYNWDDVVDGILDLLNIVPQSNGNRQVSKQQKLNLIVARFIDLKASGLQPILILDEAENLQVAMLKSIKTLYDALVKICAICLIGTDQLMVNILNKKHKNRVAIPQLWRRLKMGTITLNNINRGIEFPKFFDALKITDKALQDLCFKHCENYGELTDFLYPLIEESNGKPTAALAKKYFKLK
jgi:DNA transposition AAA+ family ATPase